MAWAAARPGVKEKAGSAAKRPVATGRGFGQQAKVEEAVVALSAQLRTVRRKAIRLNM
jgi:hypothetical protein